MKLIMTPQLRHMTPSRFMAMKERGQRLVPLVPWSPPHQTQTRILTTSVNGVLALKDLENFTQLEKVTKKLDSGLQTFSLLT